MPRILTSLKFWALACMIAWIVTVTVIIALNPHGANSADEQHPQEQSHTARLIAVPS